MGFSPHGTALSSMQLDMLDCVADERRDEVIGRFLASNAPHPFDQVRMWSLHQRLCDLPPLARQRVDEARAAGRVTGADLDRYTGIVATMVSGHWHNFGSGGYTYTAYADWFGDQRAQLGVIRNASGHSDHSGGYRVTTGHWARVAPVGVHSARDWAFVWVDPDATHLTGVGIGKPRGLALDAAVVPRVYRLTATVRGEEIGDASHTCLPHQIGGVARTVWQHFIDEGWPNAVVTYRAL